jgi:uncharacterized repeat protein (TIGR01451 family)
MVRAIVYVQPGADVAEGGASGVQARAELVSRLKTTSERTQAPLRSYLEQQAAAGQVSAYESLWIANAIALRARPDVVRELASRRAVARVDLDHWRRWVGDASASSRVRGIGSEVTSAAARTEVTPSASVAWNVSGIRADEVWHALHISGTGAVVAGMDTGVDWLHPALRRSYRGYNPHGPSVHGHNWFDATEAGALYPVDGHGHGSHTLGTVVGRDGIGVAPGARWIGVKVLNNQGYGYDAWIHAGFQWLMAPGGDPAQAPDVVNCSWGNENAYLTTFQDDLRALRAAGILAVFANGNYGPDRKSVGSPASLPEAFAVGAVDAHDEVASFSGRGPSPWKEIRPHVVAPGVHIRSSTPGGVYASMQGTSMAAPHVSGVAAMLRSVSPTLSITHTAHLVTSTTVALGEQVPNNDTGWGRVDAFAAVAALARPGFITGTVKTMPEAGSGASKPIAGAKVTATPHGSSSNRGGGGGSAVTAADGAYRLALGPGIYDMTASAFGYESQRAWGVHVVTDTTTRQSFTLTPRPTGELQVRISGVASGQALTATVSVLETPYEVVTHSHAFDLPAGRYTVRARRLGYRVVTATAAITGGETTVVEMGLPRAPSILLVDGGGWYYESEIGYFHQALDDASYAYDEWPIRDLWEDVPAASDLSAYDIVIWSAPRDAPGYIGAGEAVGEYLESGGRLLLTGQDVGFWDGGGSGYGWSPYFRRTLKVRFVDDDAPSRVVVGKEADIFAGQAITIAGPGGADNQDHPDVIAVADRDAAAPVLSYEGDGCGGVRVGTCLDYRALYLSFGFEAINERSARRGIMGRALDWLVASPPRAGLELQPQAQLGIGPAGSLVTHTVRLRHVGQAGDADQVSLALEDASWPTELSHSSLTLSPCASATLMISVTIPLTATADLRDVITLTAEAPAARSSLSPTVVSRARVETKTPAPILLVDDDRWYDQQATYREAMREGGLAYDVWETSRAGSGHGLGPTAETLQQYPVVVWWTGYDWYAPVTGDEEASLRAYLEGGGRLMLSSQDFLYYHYDDPLAQRYLGVLTYTEDITPTHLTGVAENPVGADLGPWSLTYPRGYQNWSDDVLPAKDVGVAFRDQGNRGTALTRRAGQGEETTLFLPFPFEALPAEERATTMERAVGWLSWLGGSTFAVEPSSVELGDTVTYTLGVHNDGQEAVTASLSNTLPAGLEAVDGTFSGPGDYDPVEGRLDWQGTVRPGEWVTFSYRAAVVTDTTENVVNVAALLLEDHGIRFERSASVRVGAPDLSRSTFKYEPSVVRPGRWSTCTLALRNRGSADAERATARIHPPGTLGPSEDAVWASHGVVERTDDSLTWSGPLMAGDTATLTFGLQAPEEPVRRTLYGVTFLSDGVGGSWERPEWLLVHPWPVYLPVVSRGD